MATDPNKALLIESQAADAQGIKHGLNRTQRAKVYHGQYVNGYRLSVENNRVVGVAVPVVPAVPTAVVATPGNTNASVAFKKPVQKPGQLPLTLFTVTSSPGGITATGANSPIIVPGLTNGTPYTFTVKATNSVGQGAASAASAAVTPSA